MRTGKIIFCFSHPITRRMAIFEGSSPFNGGHCKVTDCPPCVAGQQKPDLNMILPDKTKA
uniref:Uncharacterized protein n=1 Tax=Meloidogyne incognita TaxID=6306 RepID=A0A914KPW8_MELIC